MIYLCNNNKKKPINLLRLLFNFEFKDYIFVNFVSVIDLVHTKCLNYIYINILHSTAVLQLFNDFNRSFFGSVSQNSFAQ